MRFQIAFIAFVASVAYALPATGPTDSLAVVETRGVAASKQVAEKCGHIGTATYMAGSACNEYARTGGPGSAAAGAAGAHLYTAGSAANVIGAAATAYGNNQQKKIDASKKGGDIEMGKSRIPRPVAGKLQKAPPAAPKAPAPAGQMASKIPVPSKGKAPQKASRIPVPVKKAGSRG